MWNYCQTGELATFWTSPSKIKSDIRDKVMARCYRNDAFNRSL